MIFLYEIYDSTKIIDFRLDSDKVTELWYKISDVYFFDFVLPLNFKQKFLPCLSNLIIWIPNECLVIISAK